MSTAIILDTAAPDDSPESIRKARLMLGLRPQDTRRTIKRRYMRLRAQFHPDAGGDPERTFAFEEAYKAVLRNIPAPAVKQKRGRPLKHFKPPIKGRYFIVDHNTSRRVQRGGKTITETVTELAPHANGPEDKGYATREEAKAKLDEFRYLAKNDKPRAPSTDIQPARGLKKAHQPKYAVAGPAERVKAHHEGKKAEAAAKEKARTKQIAAIESHRGDYSDNHAAGDDAFHTSRCVTGGRDSNKLEYINAAHEATKGGPTAVTRRSRGNGFRSYNMIGNGPDSFDALDESTDFADSDSSLSSPARDNVSWLEFNYLPDTTNAAIKAIMKRNPGAEAWEVLVYLNGFNPTTEARAQALEGESVEDRELPSVDGFDQCKTEYTQEDYAKAEKFDETEGTRHESQPLEHIGIERLTVYTGQEEFSEFPEHDAEDFSDVLELCYPAPVAEDEPALPELPELPAVNEPLKLPPTPAQPAPDLDNCNEITLPESPNLLQS